MSDPTAPETSATAGMTFEPLEAIADAPLSPTTAAAMDATDKPKVEADGSSELTLRALVSTKEAGVIIGKAGKNVAELRDLTGVKAGVSKVVPGVHDRVLSVTGTLDGVAKAYAIIAQTLLDNPVNAPADQPAAARAPPNAVTSLRLLVSHNLMGTIIGRQGLKIKYIQDVSGARMVASKEMLPQSTERVVEVQGMVDSLRVAVWEIGKCLIEDWERGVGTVLYNPAVRLTTNTALASPSAVAASLASPVGMSYAAASSAVRVPRSATGLGPADPFGATAPLYSAPLFGADPEYLAAAAAAAASIRTQQISIPADMVGCIIGKGGAKISEIRRLSGSRISIAKVPHDESGERMFTITGTPEANEKALYLLYNQLEMEKERRMHQGVLAQQAAAYTAANNAGGETAANPSAAAAATAEEPTTAS